MNGAKLKQWFMEWWLLLVPATFALGAITTYAIAFRSMSAMENPAAWGTFGDFVGGLMNPLVSVLTLFVAISVWRLQKAELELTRNEMAQTKEAMEDQAKTAEQQRREQRFFDLLNLYKETVNSIEVSDTTSFGSDTTIETIKGKRALTIIISNAGLKRFAEDIRHAPSLSEEPDIGRANRFFALFLGHYFRVVFTLLREAEQVLGDQHFRYVKLFRAQLSRNELTSLTFNLMHNVEGTKMIPLVCRYGLLKHLHDCHLRRGAEQRLPPAAFGRKYEAATHNVLTEIHAP